MKKIPLCVPYWDESEALQAGAKYDPEFGFYCREDAFLDPLWVWLPLRYKKRPALLPEMLPETTWEENLRAALSEEKWKKLRSHVYKAAGYRCEICGEKGDPHLEAHEKWSWDDQWCVQKLEGLICLCPTCHKVHHLGLAKRLGLYDKCISKLKTVNNWTQLDVEKSIKSINQIVSERNKYGWIVDLSWLENGPYYMIYALD